MPSFTLVLSSSSMEIYHLYTYNLKGILCLWISFILTPTPSCGPVACSGFYAPGEPWWYPSAPRVPRAVAACRGGLETLNPDRRSPLPDRKAHQSWLLEGADPSTRERHVGPAGSRSGLLERGHDGQPGWASSRPLAPGGTERTGHVFLLLVHSWMGSGGWEWGIGTGTGLSWWASRQRPDVGGFNIMLQGSKKEKQKDELSESSQKQQFLKHCKENIWHAIFFLCGLLSDTCISSHEYRHSSSANYLFLTFVNASTTTGWIPLKLHTNIHGPQRLNSKMVNPWLSCLAYKHHGEYVSDFMLA